MTRKSRHDHARGLLGMHLGESGIQKSGPPPSDEELAMLLDNCLPRARRQQVLTHLIKNPALYEQWLTLVSLQAGELHPLRRRWNNLLQTAGQWLSPQTGRAIAAVAGCLILAVIALDFVSTPSPTGAPPQSQPADKPAIVLRGLPSPAPVPAGENSQPHAGECIKFAIPDQPGSESGRICVSSDESGSKTREIWRWVEAQRDAPVVLSRREVTAVSHALALSANQKWLAYTVSIDDITQVQVIDANDLATGITTLKKRFIVNDVAIAYAWQDNQLRIALGEASQTPRPILLYEPSSDSTELSQ